MKPSAVVSWFGMALHTGGQIFSPILLSESSCLLADVSSSLRELVFPFTEGHNGARDPPKNLADQLDPGTLQLSQRASGEPS